ncbi:MAG: DNA primase [Eubacteriaceae bacterium]|nr:DNA primase [Eubacteriaceae bacterium]
MGFSFSNSTIETIKSQVNIVDVVGRTVQLKRAGSNYKGCCPFHNEKTPSFVVSETKQIFTCFGCGATGDVIEFVERHYNLNFGEAIEKIAGEYGITIEKTSYNDNRGEYYRANKLAAQFFYRSFTEKANKGYAYMHGRSITPAILKKFGIGYADEQRDSLYNFLLSEGVEKKIMLELGLVSEKNGKFYDKFRNRPIFPIISTNGKVIGFGGRAIDPNDNPKYLNSPESRIFQKKNNLYGLNLSRQDVGKADFIIIVEGYMDVISLYQSGIKNVAASLGTALTENQARLIKRYTKNVVLTYDADNAGRTAALRGMEILRKEGLKVKVLHVTDGKDPDEFIKKNGKQAFLDLIENEALPYADYKLESAKVGFDFSRDEDRLDYMKKAVEILRELSPVEQDIYIKKVSRDIRISEVAIRRELEGTSGDEIRNIPLKRDSEENIVQEMSPVEKTLIKVALTEEEYIDRLKDYESVFTSDFGRKIYEILKAEHEKTERIDLKMIMDGLPVSEAGLLQEIVDSVITAGNEEQVFRECISTWRKMLLNQELDRINTMLDMADEEENQDKITELMLRTMEIQKELKCL